MFGLGRLPVRTRIGIITIGCWIGILIGVFRWRLTGDTTLLEAFNRVGLVMLALWLAWPELVIMPRWFFFALPVVIAVGAWRPMLLIYALPLLLLYWFIVPRKKDEKKTGNKSQTGK